MIEKSDEIYKLLLEAKDKGHRFTLWQRLDKKLVICHANLKTIDENKLVFEFLKESLIDSKSIYFYCKHLGYLFKAGGFICETTLEVSIPEKLLFVGNKFSIENDEKKMRESKSGKYLNLKGSISGTEKRKSKKLSTLSSKNRSKQTEIEAQASINDRRESPRSQPKVKKYISLRQQKGYSIDKKYELLDLSMGGLSFVATAKDNFCIDDKVLIIAIDLNHYEVPLDGIVRSTKLFKVNTLRVGIEFFKEGLF
jgi:hypothetical protein